ncbi:recombinase zinc beta ribbon domain-containing protein [Candidatus Parcubacteria bacterium]|nr:recombinase zinc beta ribbon domain-containing protein [Candidatus Parcubacteria bacterium]
MLSDPFYYGVILWNNDEYKGKHEPIITRELFNNVQSQMKRKYKVGQIKIHNHTFKGLIKCGDCGCLITWETQKGHHYGRCKGFKPCNEKGYIRQEEIEKTLMESFEKIKPRSDKVLNWIKKALKEAHKDKQGYSASARENLNKSRELIENRMDKIYDDKIDEVITVEYYKKRFKEYARQKEDILDQLNKMENNIKNYYEVGVEIHDLAYKARELYMSEKATADDKRTLVNKIFASLKLKDKKLIAKYTPAYQFLSEWMPKLNVTSELLKQGEEYRKTGAFAPACPVLLPGSDSNRRPIG